MTDVINNNRVKAYVDSLDRMQTEKDAARDDFNEILNEAKGDGYDPKILRKIVRLMRQDPQKRREEEEITRLYMDAVGAEL